MEEQVILYQGLLFEFQWNMRQTSSTLKGNEGELIRNLREWTWGEQEGGCRLASLRPWPGLVWSSVGQVWQYLRSRCCTVLVYSKGHNSYGTSQRKGVCSRKNGWIQGCGGAEQGPWGGGEEWKIVSASIFRSSLPETKMYLQLILQIHVSEIKHIQVR